MVQRIFFWKKQRPKSQLLHHEKKNCEIVILRQIGSKKPLVSKGRIPTFFYIALSPLTKFGQVLLWKIPLYLTTHPPTVRKFAKELMLYQTCFFHFGANFPNLPRKKRVYPNFFHSPLLPLTKFG